MITFQCLECDSDLEVDDTPPLGYKIHCAYCGAIFEVVAVDPLEVDWADDDDVGHDDADDLLDIALDDDIILDDDALDDDALDDDALDDDALGDDVLDDDLTELNGAPRRTGAASRANTSKANATPLNDELDETVVDDLSGALDDDPDDDEEEDDWVFGDDDEDDDDWDFDDDEEDDDWDFDDDEEDDEDSRWT